MPAHARNPTVSPVASVIIPYRNAADTLSACLGTLAAQEGAPPFEVVAVDNNSTDQSVRAVQNFADTHPDLPVRLAAEPTPGPAAARNTGVRAARGGLLLFTDADCLPSPGWVAEMVGHFRETPDVGAISGGIRPKAPGGVVEKFTALYTLPPHRREEIHTQYTLLTGGFQTANLGVPRAVFEKAGGFDPRLFTGEDHDLCRRIYQLGLSIRAVPDALVLHRHRTSLKGMMRQAFGYGRAHAYALRHFVPGAVIVALPWLGTLQSMRPRARVWLDLGQADKKLLLLAALAGVRPLLALLLPLYLARLALAARKRANELRVPLSVSEAAVVPLLMVLKAAALTTGRLRGGLGQRVLCF
ncbi:MAG: glycosyltransferase [Kiritimatiellaeota bacterium]|nr:glycosyltransferase [Kiritimatiellota bacterium]